MISTFIHTSCIENTAGIMITSVERKSSYSKQDFNQRQQKQVKPAELVDHVYLEGQWNSLGCSTRKLMSTHAHRGEPEQQVKWLTN